MNRTSLQRNTVWLVALSVSGCALSPGFHIDDSKFKVAENLEQRMPADRSYPVIPITPSLLSTQAARQRQLSNSKINPVFSSQTGNFKYLVGAGDVVGITLFGHPEIAVTAAAASSAGSASSAAASGYMVDQDGKILLPFLGKQSVAGKTTDEIRSILTQEYTPYIRNPQLFVQVTSYRSQRVNVAGEVKRPGILPITSKPLTIVDAISQSDGVTNEADLSNVQLTRAGRTEILNLKRFYERGDLSQNVLLENGDIIEVPDRSQHKIYVLGEVKQPASYQMRNGHLTLADAIGGAGGFSPAANPQKLYVIRGEPIRPTIYQLDAESPNAMLLASQFQLLPKDVVYVSPSEISRWNSFITNLLPMMGFVGLSQLLK